MSSSARTVVLLACLLAPGSAWAKGEKTGWLYIQRYLSDAQLKFNKGIAQAPFWFYNSKGEVVPGKPPDGVQVPGQLVQVPVGDYFVVAGQRNIGLTRVKYTVVASRVTVVRTGFVQVSTWKDEELPKLECSPWDAEMTAFVRAPGGAGAEVGPEWMPVLSNPAVEFHTRHFGMLQLPVGQYRILWHGFTLDVEIKEGQIYRLPLGTAGPLGEDRPKARLSRDRGESAGNPALFLCADGPTHVLARTYWMSYAKALEVFPYEERVWNTQEVQPINDHGYARRLPEDDIRKSYHKGAGSEPTYLPLAKMARPTARDQAPGDGADSLLDGDDGIDWEAPP